MTSFAENLDPLGFQPLKITPCKGVESWSSRLNILALFSRLSLALHVKTKLSPLDQIASRIRWSDRHLGHRVESSWWKFTLLEYEWERSAGGGSSTKRIHHPTCTFTFPFITHFSCAYLIRNLFRIRRSSSARKIRASRTFLDRTYVHAYAYIVLFHSNELNNLHSTIMKYYEVL